MTAHDHRPTGNRTPEGVLLETAVAAVLSRHKDFLVDYLFQMTGSKDAAVELALESATALGRPKNLDRARKDPKKWLLREATRRVARNERRSRLQRWIRPRFDRPPDPPAYEEGIAPGKGQAAWERAEQEQPIRKALGSVRAGVRRLLVLCDILGMPADEAAHLTGLSQNELKTRLERGRVLYLRAVSTTRES